MADAGDVIKVANIMRLWDFSQCVNVFHVQMNDDAPDVQSMESISNWLEAIYSEFNDSITNTLAYEKIEAFNITGAYPMPIVTMPTLTDGAGTGERLPSGVAALSLFRTGVSHVTGKKYWPPLTEGALVSGLWGTGVLVDINDGADVAANTWNPVVGPGFTPGVWRDGPNTFVPFISSFTSAEPAYQRRRKPGRGS